MMLGFDGIHSEGLVMVESRSFIANNWFKLIIVFFGFAILFIYFSRQGAMDSCIGDAADLYQKEWAFQCKDKKLGDNCTLPRFLADMMEKDRQNRVEQCIKRYSFK